MNGLLKRATLSGWQAWMWGEVVLRGLQQPPTIRHYKNHQVKIKRDADSQQRERERSCVQMMI